MSKFNIHDNHPIIPNANLYFFEKKYISIHSEDRDIVKYPSSTEFEITLPEDYLNLASCKLMTWSFPANYSVFCVENLNMTMSFKITKPYNPGSLGISNPLLEGIFAALYNNLDHEYIITIEPGFYNPEQISTELTNKFNEAMTVFIRNYFTITPAYNSLLSSFIAYERFNIVYNLVNQKLWFGNGADQFVLTNDSVIYFKNNYLENGCSRKQAQPQFTNWGLPNFLGFSRCAAYALDSYQYLSQSTTGRTPSFISDYLNTNGDVIKLPRFYYGDARDLGDNGYWLLPRAPKATVYYLEAPFKISIMGPAYMYMEIDGLNCLDETLPWALSEFSVHNSKTSGVVNSAFAKIAIPTTPISQWFDGGQYPYKYFNPPAERIRKLNIKIRYHNGQLVDFGQFEYSFMLEFNLLRPQQQRAYSIRDAYGLSQTETFSSSSSNEFLN
jgi:hypothetical protein